MQKPMTILTGVMALSLAATAHAQRVGLKEFLELDAKAVYSYEIEERTRGERVAVGEINDVLRWGETNQNDQRFVFRHKHLQYDLLSTSRIESLRDGGERRYLGVVDNGHLVRWWKADTVYRVNPGTVALERHIVSNNGHLTQEFTIEWNADGSFSLKANGEYVSVSAGGRVILSKRLNDYDARTREQTFFLRDPLKYEELSEKPPVPETSPGTRPNLPFRKPKDFPEPTGVKDAPAHSLIPVTRAQFDSNLAQGSYSYEIKEFSRGERVAVGAGVGGIHKVLRWARTGQKDQRFLFLPEPGGQKFRIQTLREDVNDRVYVAISPNGNAIAWSRSDDNNSQVFQIEWQPDGQTFALREGTKGEFLDIRDNGEMWRWSGVDGRNEKPRPSQLFQFLRPSISLFPRGRAGDPGRGGTYGRG